MEVAYITKLQAALRAECLQAISPGQKKFYRGMFFKSQAGIKAMPSNKQEYAMPVSTGLYFRRQQEQ